MSAEWSVVIPTHNTRDLTCRCLASLDAATGLQVIVVDDASRDGTSSAIERRFPRVERLRFEENVGFAAAANAGLSRAKGAYLLLLNSDTEVPAGSWGPLREAFDEDPRLGVAGGQLLFPDRRPQWSGGPEPGLAWLFAMASGLPALLGRVPGYRALRSLSRGGGASVHWVPGAAMAFRRSVWEDVGPLDEGFRFYCQDLDFCLRARQAGWEVAVIPEFRVIHHHGATIGGETGAAGHQHPELLWSDLVLWAHKHRGERWGGRAAAAIRWGARIRLLLRGAGRPFRSAGERRAWRRDTLSYRRALHALERAPDVTPASAATPTGRGGENR